MVASLSFAQDFKPAAVAGAKSLNFCFGGFGAFSPTAYGPLAGLSASYFLSNDMAVRVGLQVKSTSQSIPWNDPSGNNTNPGSDGSKSVFQLGVGGDLLMYMPSMTARVRPYIGGGLGIAMQSTDDKKCVSNAAATGTVLEVKNGTAGDGFSFGILGIAGAEFFLFPEISFSAEYNLNLFNILSNSDTETSTKNQTAVTTKNGSVTTILGFSAANAGLHIYF